MAERLNLAVDDVVELELNGKKIQGAVARPGIPTNSVTITLGYGRTHAGRVSTCARLQRLRTSHLRQSLDLA